MIKKILTNWLFIFICLLAAVWFWGGSAGIYHWCYFLLLVLGVILGWFFIPFFLRYINQNHLTAVVLQSAAFQVGLAVFSFWLIISCQDFTAQGLILGINLQQMAHLEKNCSNHFYMAGAGLVFALMILLVLL